MNGESGAGGASVCSNDLGLDALMRAVEEGRLAPTAQSGRRSRRRAMKARAGKAGLVAAVLAAEGCVTFSGDEQVDLTTPPAPPNAAPSAVDDGGFNSEDGETVMIAASDLTANDSDPDGDPLEIVEVFGAQNGTAVLTAGGVVEFTPAPDFIGVATFQYRVSDGNGGFSEATAEINVGAPPQFDQPQDQTGQMDDSMMAEHQALLDLVPPDQATHTAVNNGSWFDPNTWANGEVPGEGAKVVIPEGITVDYDGASDVSILTVRVDGALDFATDIDTFLEVDTMVVTQTGALTIGTEENPVAAGVEAVIQIADNGPIDVGWDPLLFSRGVVSLGDVEIHGAEKDAFLKVAVDPMAGDTSITLEAPPEGWNAGDRLVLTGTHLVQEEREADNETRIDNTEDEELIITAIDGNTITFDRPLAFDHDSPRADLKAYVANYSRNVRFTTENADTAEVYERGHTMFMGEASDVDVRYAEFTDLGRTDKSERAFDVTDLDQTAFDSNIKARYPLHLHHTGVDDIENPAMLVGNTVWGSPGWGVVHHDSNAILADNAVYNAFGSGFVAETGNETGRWIHNISIKSLGMARLAKDFEDVQAFDLGRNGSGFWFQGRLIDAVGNVAAGVPGGHGFVFMSRGSNGDVIPVLSENTDQPESLGYLDTARINIPAITAFDDNEAFAVRTGVEVIKAGPNQGHDVRSVFDGFTAWEVHTGALFQYTAHYTLIDFDLIGTDSDILGLSSTAGIVFWKNNFEMVVNGATIEGFHTGVDMTKGLVGGIEDNVPNLEFGYTFIDVDVQNAVVDFSNVDAGDQFLTSADLADVSASIALDFGTDIPLAPTETGAPRPNLFLDGVKTDSLGDQQVGDGFFDPIGYDVFEFQALAQDEGYWTLPDGRSVVIVELYVADRATGKLSKIGVPVEVTDKITDGATYNGVIDLDSAAPIANDDSATTSVDTSVIIDVLANDSDPDGDPINVDGLYHPEHGRVFDNGDGTLTYTPDPGYTGTDYFFYWVEDGNGNFTQAHVGVTVTDV
ncbi:MAG: Ig-like domain-containing protein [Parvularculaceae bacterium]